MRIISRRKGKEKHPGASIALDVWYSKARAAEWGKPTDLLADFNNALTIENNRAIFNLNKNDFRLVVFNCVS